MEGVEFEMKKRWNSGSDLVEKLFDNVEKYKKIEKECYKTCNEILKDEMVDMDKPVKVTYQGKTLFEGKVKRTAACLARTLKERGDKELMFSGYVDVKI